MLPDDRVFIQWAGDNIVHEVTYEKSERGFLIFRSDAGSTIIARRNSLSRCEVKENGNEQRNLRETPETILSGTI